MPDQLRSSLRALLPLWLLTLISPAAVMAEDIDLTLRFQQETGLHTGRFHQLTRAETWKPEETAIIVCDVWDYHHCLNAVRRLEEFLPRLNSVLTKAREQGVTIIHSPSDCMAAYAQHPARARAISTPKADFVPEDCTSWCSRLPAEERGLYPIDQSDGGEDDDPEEHAAWAAKLKRMGRNPGQPWQKQAEAIAIDDARDYISDKGDEVWNVLQQRGIRNVILTGVHTNMCVLGRPFGLRQMARNGKNVVLMRDLTDTMYNPKRWPYVSHFTGTDLIVSHIERYVCPTISSDQILGGAPFRFRNDTRPHLVMLIAEDEYQTEQTLPEFADTHLGRDFRVTTVFGSEVERNSLPGIEAVREADVLLVSIRRRVLPTAEMQLIRDYVSSGKPVIGIRTASHAFSLRDKQPPEGFADWPEFDAAVFGGNYHGHHGNELKSVVQVTATAPTHDVLEGISRQPVPQGGSLYKTSPLAEGTTVLTIGTIEGQPPEPVSWTFQRDAGVVQTKSPPSSQGGGRSFYTSMGHVDDFDNPVFTQLLYQGICWAAGISPTKPIQTAHWSPIDIPVQDVPTALAWYRCAVRFPADTGQHQTATLSLPGHVRQEGVTAWLNGHELQPHRDASATGLEFVIPGEVVQAGDANLLVLRVDETGQQAMTTPPAVSWDCQGTSSTVLLRGRWQQRTGDHPEYADIPLPAKFGAAADIVFSLDEPLWTARPVTRPGEFTPGIEGPACDAAGYIYAVNYQKQGTIGRISPDGSGEVFVTLPDGSVGNGIRFDKDGNFLVADYPQHNILKVNTQTREVTTLAHHSGMNQPNDLAIAPDGTLYASDPNWKNGTGQLWRIDPDGTTTLLAADMGTTNGIDVSPDGKTLYVNESVQRNVWAFDIQRDRTLTGKRLIRQFPDHGFDGMRCDVDGNLYIARYGAGTVVKMTPQGELLQSVNVLGARPSNVCFGGPDGCTVYVTEVEGTRLVSFRVDRPGRSWAEQHQRQTLKTSTNVSF
ncbi:MAG: SMP-30/gluconolactonase/LRE family protein [Fuerstiella sp.]